MSTAPPRRPLWQWFLLLTPAVEVIAITFWIDPLARALPIGGELPGLALLVFNLLLAAVLCLALGLWFAWLKPSWPRRLALGLLYGVAIATVNAGVAWAGCVLTHSL